MDLFDKLIDGYRVNEDEGNRQTERDAGDDNNPSAEEAEG